MAEGGAAAADREARRRKIAERGSDRMALITGRIQNLPPPIPSPIRSSHSEQSLPPLPNATRSHCDVPVKAMMGESASSKFSRGKAFNYRKAEPPLPKHDTSTRPPAHDMQQKNEKKPLIAPPKTSTSSSAGNENFRKRTNVYSAKEINSCIIATESTRVFCSVVIALLVVLANLNLPYSIVKSTSTIASRPLYILLVSDVTIVILKLLQKKRDSEKFDDDGHLRDWPNWLEAVQILEIGLVLYQAIRALFIDVSCYTVIIICGLCLV